MTSSPTSENVIPYALLGMTAVTGLVDAVSFLSLGHVFTANMTGNIVFLAFATAHVSGLSVARSSTALLAFLVGRYSVGRVMARAECRFTHWFRRTSVPLWRSPFYSQLRFAASDTAAICWNILFNRSL